MNYTSHQTYLITFRVSSAEAHPGKAPRKIIYILPLEQILEYDDLTHLTSYTA